jgi:hypothetical protein
MKLKIIRLNISVHIADDRWINKWVDMQGGAKVRTHWLSLGYNILGWLSSGL